ncbi:MAG TPA: type II toxin-antitoxin system VapC family toxin [Rhizobiales bacterium]|nr:type II toxin-antitoxin system VapC family toxin [Hyphomicrobiales bacterium]
MHYFDTSYLAPLIVDELYTAPVVDFLTTLDRSELWTSRWTLVEFASMLARGVRMRTLSRQEADGLQDRFERMTASTFSVILPETEDYTKAASFLARTEAALRGPDAMHLAVAENHGATAILSLDKKMIAAGRALGLPIGTVMPLPGFP